MFCQRSKSENIYESRDEPFASQLLKFSIHKPDLLKPTQSR